MSPEEHAEVQAFLVAHRAKAEAAAKAAAEALALEEAAEKAKADADAAIAAAEAAKAAADAANVAISEVVFVGPRPSPMWAPPYSPAQSEDLRPHWAAARPGVHLRSEERRVGKECRL